MTVYYLLTLDLAPVKIDNWADPAVERGNTAASGRGAQEPGAGAEGCGDGSPGGDTGTSSGRS